MTTRPPVRADVYGGVVPRGRVDGVLRLSESVGMRVEREWRTDHRPSR